MEKTISTRPTETYLVWMDGDDEQYYNLYTSLKDAVIENEGIEIFKADLKSLGKFEAVVQTKLKKIKKQKGSK